MRRRGGKLDGFGGRQFRQHGGSPTSLVRQIFMMIVLGYMFQKHVLRDWLLPYGPAWDGPSELYAPVDYTNDLLQFKHGHTQRLYERFRSNSSSSNSANETTTTKKGCSSCDTNSIESSSESLLNGPETVLFDKMDDTMYVMTEDANLVKLDDFQIIPGTNERELSARTTFIKSLGMGRPLGGAFTYATAAATTNDNNNHKNNKKKNNDGNTNNENENRIITTLYIGDAALGLTRVVDVFNPKSKVEIVASHVYDDIVTIETYRTRDSNNSRKFITIQEEVIETKLTPILYANDVTVGPKSGMIYFTDSTNIAPERYVIKPQFPERKKNKRSADDEEVEDDSINEEVNTENLEKMKKTSSTVKAWKSSEPFVPPYGTYRWDTLYASKLDLIRRGRSGTGRLLQYNPQTDTVKVLVRGLHFPNGISVIEPQNGSNSNNDNNNNNNIDNNTVIEEEIIFSETFGIRLYKYNTRTEHLDVIVDSKHFPGYLDGTDCAPSSSPKQNGLAVLLDKMMPWKKPPIPKPTMCYAVMPSSIPHLIKFLNTFIPFNELNRIVRTLVMTLPKVLLPKPVPFGGLIEVNMETGTHRLLLDPAGTDLQFLTGVTYNNGKLYFGSLQNNYIGIYNIEQATLSSLSSESKNSNDQSSSVKKQDISNGSSSSSRINTTTNANEEL